MAHDDLRVPAGWYPDPLGLPQLRWWDNHQWTEFTTEAPTAMGGDFASAPTNAAGAYGSASTSAFAEAQTTIPTVVKSTRLSFADPFEDEAEAANAETAEAESAGAGTTDGQGYGAPLRELESFDAPAAEQAPAPAYAAAFAPASAESAPSTTTLDEQFEQLLSGSGTAGMPHSASEGVSAMPQHSAGLGGASFDLHGMAAPAVATPDHAHTGSVWAIALMPLAILVPGLLFLLSGLVGQASSIFLGLILVVPYVLGAGLAYVDGRRLRSRGFTRPPSWAWSLLTAPVYLLLRSRAVARELGGAGYAPLMTWLGVAAVNVVSAVVAPGLVLALSPQAFSDQAAASIEAQAAQFAIAMDVDCPDTPPLLPGLSFECAAQTNAGDHVSLTVTLERDLGWIAWRVADWGGMR